MKIPVTIGVFLLLSLIGCKENKGKISSINPVNWNSRFANPNPHDSLQISSTYLSIYSQIYSRSEDIILDLTATVSIRNTDKNDTIYIDKAQYYDSNGKLIRSYFDHTIFISPMETVEIVIDQYDKSGGTGANFIFDWRKRPTTNTPLFEGVMISASGNLGLSFTTVGHKIH